MSSAHLAASPATRPPASRVCDWCDGPIPPRARRDAQCCSKRCRQARHRFTRAAGRAALAGGPPLRLAFADPPYPGNAYLYRAHPDYGGEVDHGELLTRLAAYDGWALSTSAAALPAVLGLCPPGVRVAAWHRGERPSPSWEPLNAWEPVIYRPGRPVDPASIAGRRTDSLVCGVTPVTTRPGRVPGAKPAAFCRWVFGLLGAAPGDKLDDLYPGSGAVSRAWAAFTAGEPSRVTGADASCTTTADASSQARADGYPAGCEPSFAAEHDSLPLSTSSPGRHTTMNADDSSQDETPAQQLARQVAEAHPGLTEAAADPSLPAAARKIFGQIGEMSVDAAVASVRTERSLKRAAEQYDTMAAVLFSEDMTVLAAILRNRLSPGQLADLIVKLDSPASTGEPPD